MIAAMPATAERAGARGAGMFLPHPIPSSAAAGAIRVVPNSHAEAIPALVFTCGDDAPGDASRTGDMGILRWTLSLLLALSATTACVWVNVHVGAGDATAVHEAGVEPPPIAGKTESGAGEGTDAEREAGRGATDDAGAAGGVRGGPADEVPATTGGRWSGAFYGRGSLAEGVLGWTGDFPPYVNGSPDGHATADGSERTGGENTFSRGDGSVGQEGQGVGRGGIAYWDTIGAAGSGVVAGITNGSRGAGPSLTDGVPGEGRQAQEAPPPTATAAAPPVPVESEMFAPTPPVPPVVAEPFPSDLTAAAPSASLAAEIDAYLDRLSHAAYTFNPPSPIKVARPRTVYLWLDPTATPEGLAAELREVVPEDAPRVESGETLWSPIMEATLTGSAFQIEAVRPERQSVSSTHRTTWAWEVTATQVGKRLPFHLTLNVILPPELGPPHTIAPLDRYIDVEVTWWWAFDHYFDRYWQWLLGGLGTTLAGVIAWWWKRRTAATPAPASAGT